MPRCPVLRSRYKGDKRRLVARANGVTYHVDHYVIGGWSVMAKIGSGKFGFVGDKYGKPATSLGWSLAKAKRIVCDHAAWYRRNFKTR